MEFTTQFSGDGIVNTSEVLTIFGQNYSSSTTYVNQTSTTPVDNSSAYDLAITPLSGLSYAIFGLTCLVVAVGLFGNSLILAVIFKGRTTPLKGHDVLISGLAIFDAVALFPTALSQPRIYEVTGVDIRAFTTVGCKLFMAVFLCAGIFSFSVVVLICLERFVAVWFPLRARILSRTFVLRCLLITVTTVIMVYGTLAVLYSEIGDGICDLNFSGQIYSSVLRKIPNTTVYNGIIGFNLILYLLILFILTPMIIVKLYQQVAARRRLAPSAAEEQGVNIRTTVKLTAVIVTFLILVALPAGIALVVGLAGTRFSGTSQTRAILSWVTLGLLLNHSINFVIYDLIDTEFRRKTFSMLCAGKGTGQMKAPKSDQGQDETSFTDSG